MLAGLHHFVEVLLKLAHLVRDEAKRVMQREVIPCSWRVIRMIVIGMVMARMVVARMVVARMFPRLHHA